MDIVPMYLKSGESLFAREGLQKVHFVQADMLQLPFRRENFDFVFFSLYTHASERRFEILDGVRRILRPDGFVLLSAGTPLYRIKHPLVDGEACVANAKQLRQEVSSCGFELLESVVDSGRPEYRFSILRKHGATDDEEGCMNIEHGRLAVLGSALLL